MGCRMEDNLGSILLEELLHSRPIQHIGDQRDDPLVQARFTQFLFDLEQLHFGLFEQQQAAGSIGSDLPAQFTPYAAPRSRYHYHPPL